MFFQQFFQDITTKETLLSSTSQVVPIDLSTQRPIKIKDCLPLSTLKSIHIPLSFVQLPPLTSSHCIREQDIFYDHIDFNHHVNNTHYVSFAERSLSSTFLKKARLKRIRIAYKQAALLGDKVQIQTRICPGFTDHQIVSTPEPDTPKKYFARVRLSWERKQKD